MILSKIQTFFKSFRNKAILIIALIIITAALLLSKYILPASHEPELLKKNENIQDKNTVNSEFIRQNFSSGIDSVLRNFGIKDEWITTSDSAALRKTGKTQTQEAELFTKNILIPNELTSIEVNADLSSYISFLGLSSRVNEDIVLKNLDITILNNDTSKNNFPLAKLKISHSDKVIRESAAVCIIINNINEYSTEEIDRLFLNKNEFSYVFPKNLDEIDLQNKLLHSKKDVIINLSIGNKENFEADFNASMDEKAVLERVRSFSVDFPTVNNVMLTKQGEDIPQNLINMVNTILSNYKIRVINENELSQLLSNAENESTDKFTLFAANIKSKGKLAKTFITTVDVEKDDFEKFYDNILILKKLGYKFYNYSEYRNKRESYEKEQKEKEDKIKEELVKKQNEKKQIEKKQNEKKNTVVKKKTDVKKPVDKKKSEPKKKSDVKKK